MILFTLLIWPGMKCSKLQGCRWVSVCVGGRKKTVTLWKALALFLKLHSIDIRWKKVMFRFLNGKLFSTRYRVLFWRTSIHFMTMNVKTVKISYWETRNKPFLTCITSMWLKQYLCVETWWDLADCGRVPAVSLVAVGTLDENGTVAEALCEHLPSDVIQPHTTTCTDKRR